MVLCSTWTLWLTENMDECTAGHHRVAAETIIRSLNALFVKIWSHLIFLQCYLRWKQTFIDNICYLHLSHLTSYVWKDAAHSITLLYQSQSRSSIPPILHWLTSKGQFVAVWSQFCIFSFLKLKHWSLFLGKKS